MASRYIDWLLRQGVQLYEGQSLHWRVYNGGLVPASPSPQFCELPDAEAQSLLEKSGAWFCRYSSRPSQAETAWWYIAYDVVSDRRFSSNTRSKVNRGRRHCEVRAIEPQWLASHGYETYRSAHERYRNAAPLSEETFARNVAGSAGGPFEYWGVFVGETLAAYCQCIVEEENVDTSVTRFHPAYLKYYSSYALISWLIETYVEKRGLGLSNGDRPISHETNFQDFLIRMGFQKKYCRLNVVYRRELDVLVRMTFPFRKMIAALPDRGVVHKVNSVLFQEELRRLCL